MIDPAYGECAPLAQADAASQRKAMLRGRGPHPLPVFLDTVTRACGDDRAALARVLAGLRRYQGAPPAAPRPQRAVVAAIGGAVLRDFGGDGPIVVVVPSLINPPTVLDLAPGNSFMAGLANQGLRPLLLDWGATEALGLEDLVAQRLVPLVAGLAAPVALVGYCLGGTLAPWHFSGYGEARAGLADWWRGAGPLSAQLGVLPIEVLQPAFWSLDPAGMAAKYARLADLPETSVAAVAAFTALEDWSNSGQPLALAAAHGLVETLFRDNRPGRGQWLVGGCPIAPAALGVPILDVIAGRDRIVPPATALSGAGPGTALVLDAGHVGMVVGGRAPAMLWEPLADWLHG
jgi:polyhydroxyalkanoate synthase subunit PhaC